MKNIFQESFIMVAGGAKFKVDFIKRTLKIDGKLIIDNGKFEGESGLSEDLTKNVLDSIENFYLQYKYSIPSDRSESKRFRYFKALPEHELEDNDMLYGLGRDAAQLQLELFVLLCIIENKLVWDEQTMGKWFWQSSIDKDLVILRDWVTSNNPTINN